MDKQEFTKRLGDKIREHRKRLGISQTELGRRIGKDQQHIQLIESGKTTCTSYTLYVISLALDCEVGDLM